MDDRATELSALGRNERSGEKQCQVQDGMCRGKKTPDYPKMHRSRVPLSLCFCLLQFSVQHSLICRCWDVLNSLSTCAFWVVAQLDVFGRASAHTWCSNPAVLCEGAHFGSRDLGLPQLSMQKAAPGDGFKDVVP